MNIGPHLSWVPRVRILGEDFPQIWRRPDLTLERYLALIVLKFVLPDYLGMVAALLRPIIRHLHCDWASLRNLRLLLFLSAQICQIDISLHLLLLCSIGKKIQAGLIFFNRKEGDNVQLGVTKLKPPRFYLASPPVQLQSGTIIPTKPWFAKPALIISDMRISH